METNAIYVDIVSEYATCKSIAKIAKYLGVSEERVRRTLITEGLWTSRSAKPIIKLFHEGKTVPEIAENLMISEKTVQSYIPYSRGMYGGERSDTAQRSGEYRDRMRKAVEGMVSNNMAHTSEDEVSEIISKQRMDNKVHGGKDGRNPKVTGEQFDEGLSVESRCVYQLRFELTSSLYYGADDRYGMTDEERGEFLRLAKAQNGIRRTVLVPGEMSLHAMHYMILRLFGWQNEHLHRFSLSENTFKQLTGEEIGRWLELCGVLLRFPTSDNTDLYWDDDYKPNQSVKTWLRSKYIKSYAQKSISESLLTTLSEIADFEKRFMAPDGNRAKLKKRITLDELRHTVVFEEDFNTVLERLRVCDLFLAESEMEEITVDSWNDRILKNRAESMEDIADFVRDKKSKKKLDEAVEELKSWRNFRSSIDSALFYGRRVEVEKQLGQRAEEAIREADEAIPEWEDEVFNILDAYNPSIVPFLNQLYYLYDFGDDWCIRITCEKRFLRKDVLSTRRYFDNNNIEIVGDEWDRLAEVDSKKHPLCIESDGVSLVEDPGGIYGFYEMLKTLTGDDPEEKRRMKEWAKGLGWTGRMCEPEKML